MIKGTNMYLWLEISYGLLALAAAEAGGGGGVGGGCSPQVLPNVCKITLFCLKFWYFYALTFQLAPALSNSNRRLLLAVVSLELSDKLGTYNELQIYQDQGTLLLTA